MPKDNFFIYGCPGQTTNMDSTGSSGGSPLICSSKRRYAKETYILQNEPNAVTTPDFN